MANFSSSCSLHYAPIWTGNIYYCSNNIQHCWAELALFLSVFAFWYVSFSFFASLLLAAVCMYIWSRAFLQWHLIPDWHMVDSHFINSGLQADFCALCCRCNLICEPCSLLLTYLCWETVSQLTCNYPGPAQNVPSFLCRQCFGWLTANHFTGTRIRTKEILF